MGWLRALLVAIVCLVALRRRVREVSSRRRRRTREAPERSPRATWALPGPRRPGRAAAVSVDNRVRRPTEACRVARRARICGPSAERCPTAAATRSIAVGVRWDRKCQLGHCTGQAYCGNGMCDAGETCESCPGDCGCGTGRCVAAACCTPNCAGKDCGDGRLRRDLRSGMRRGPFSARQAVRGERLLRKRCVQPHGQGGLQHVLGGLRLQRRVTNA